MTTPTIDHNSYQLQTGDLSLADLREMKRGALAHSLQRVLDEVDKPQVIVAAFNAAI